MNEPRLPATRARLLAAIKACKAWPRPCRHCDRLRRSVAFIDSLEAARKAAGAKHA